VEVKLFAVANPEGMGHKAIVFLNSFLDVQIAHRFRGKRHA